MDGGEVKVSPVIQTFKEVFCGFLLPKLSLLFKSGLNYFC